MADNRVTVVVSNKFLQIDDVSSEFEFLNNYLLLYILIRFIISVCFLSLDYCINIRMFSLYRGISQSLAILSLKFFYASSFKIYYLFYEVRFFLVVLELLCFVAVPQFVFSSLFYNLVNQSVEHYRRVTTDLFFGSTVNGVRQCALIL